MSKLYRLILGENCTNLNGTVIHFVPAGRNDSKQEAVDTDDYNAVGAMEFIVATILLYAFLGVFCTLLIKIKRCRGQSHFNSMMDESVTRYLKEENTLKFDGQRTSLRRACRLVSRRIQEVETGSQARLETEREVSSEMAPETRHKKLKKKRRRRKSKMREVGGTSQCGWIGNSEAQFVAPGSGPDSTEQESTSITDANQIVGDIPAYSTCDSLES